MISRLRKEGYPFIGVALPAFARDFESSLRVGHCRDAPFLGFRRAKGRWLPSFLSGFTSRIFSQDGTVLPNADPFCIYAVRQITLAWAKCLFPIEQTMVERGITRYLETEQELKHWDASFSEDSLEFIHLQQVFDLLFSVPLNAVNDRIANGDVNPRHGPGFTASKAIGNAKWSDLRWTQRLARVFPYQEFIRASVHHDLDCDEPVLLSPGDEDPVRVTFVPKTVDKCLRLPWSLHL